LITDLPLDHSFVRGAGFPTCRVETVLGPVKDEPRISRTAAGKELNQFKAEKSGAEKLRRSDLEFDTARSFFCP
jgi:hypothetical protein